MRVEKSAMYLICTEYREKASVWFYFADTSYVPGTVAKRLYLNFEFHQSTSDSIKTVPICICVSSRTTYEIQGSPHYTINNLVHVSYT